MAAGVPMAVPVTARAPPAQGQEPASRGPNRLQVVDLTAEQSPSAAAQEPQTLEMLTEEEKASLSLLDLREHIVVTESDHMDITEDPFVHHMLSLRDAAEEIENAACHDHAMPDVGKIRNAAGEQTRDNDLLTATQVKGQVTGTKYQPVRAAETKYQPKSLLKDVRGLLSTGLLEGFRVTYRKNEVEMTGRIDGLGYSCGCSECGYRNIMNACEFEKHAGQLSNNQNAHIFLDSGISLYILIQKLKYKKLCLLVNFIEKETGLPPNLSEYGKWEASFQVESGHLDVAAASEPCSTQSSQESAAGVTNHTAFATTFTDCLKELASTGSSNLNWSKFRRPRWQYKRGVTETSTPTLSRRSKKGATGISTVTSMKSNTEEIPSENTAGPHSSEVIKPVFAVPAAVISTSSECDPINLPFSLSSPVSVVQEPPPDHSVVSKSKEFRPPKKVRDNSLHQLVFKEGGLPDLTLLTYKLKNGEVLKQGYKQGTGIVCGCCNEEFTPSQFENHAGMGKRRQPYRSIYTSGGLTLHKLALKLQDSLNSSGISSDVSDIDEPPNLACSGSSKESPTSDTPIIVPLKRTLQERVRTVSCHLCGDARTTVGTISEDMIVFCNQCERPCHIKCYNNGLEKQKAPSSVLGEYMKFHFLCCQKCQLLRASLHQEQHKREKIRLKRSNVCWQLLSGMNPRSNVQQYMHQVMVIFKDAFPETAAHDSDVIHDMLNGNVCGEKDFRGMYSAVLTTSSKLVVSAAILKMHTEEVAELVLVATRNDCRKKGYFTLLLRQIEAHLKALNVRLLTVPVDPEMASIWSEKLGFTILPDEKKESLLEAHPLVMFEDLTLMQKSLADVPDLMVSKSEVTVGELSAQFS